MAEEPLMNEDGVRALARAAALPLSDDRVADLASLLSDWLPAANDLSRTMSAPEYRGTTPITAFGHLPADPME